MVTAGRDAALKAKAAAYLLVAGVAFLIAGGIIILWICVCPLTFRETEAEVVTSVFSDSTDMIEPIVRFDVDGETVEHRAQPVKIGLKAGDRVRIAYGRRKHFGLEGWRIYVGKDAASAARSATALYVAAGVAAMLAGAAMLVVALIMKKRMV